MTIAVKLWKELDELREWGMSYTDPHGIPRVEGKIRSALGIRIMPGGQEGKRGPPDNIYRKHGEESHSVCRTCGSVVYLKHIPTMINPYRVQKRVCWKRIHKLQ